MEKLTEVMGVSEKGLDILSAQFDEDTGECIHHWDEKGIYVMDIAYQTGYHLLPQSPEKIKRELIKRLVQKLNNAANDYYNGSHSNMSDKEYDKCFDDLVYIENETGIILPDSPTHKVGAEIVSELKKVTHEFPALSLDKTKDIDLFIRKFSEGVASVWHSENVCLMWKMDGSTIVATYEDGILRNLATRGNGYVGSDITHNAPFIKGLPQTIPYNGKIIIRGEAVMSYKEFKRINAELSEEEQYKNPRNLCNATIQLLDSNEMRKREIHFKCFDWVYSEQLPNDFLARFEILEDWGIECVEHYDLAVEELKNMMQSMEDRVESYEFPVDGLVACLSDVMYADTLPGTEHNPNIMRGYAFKWADETVETILRDIEWSASRTGLLNPIAVFDPVELEGTTVTRASLHNVSYIMDKNLHIGDRITVYKANKIIPQVDSNLDSGKYDNTDIKDAELFGPKKCPVCGGKVIYTLGNDNTVTAKCDNFICAAKQIGKIVHMCDRDCLNIVGLSEEKITYLVNHGYINNRYDLFVQARNYEEGYGILNEAGDDLEEQDGWGKQSVKNLADAINKARDTDFVSFIHAMSINNVGKGQAKALKKYLDTNYEQLIKKYHPVNDGSYDLLGLLEHMVWCDFNFTKIEGFGKVIADSLKGWIQCWLTEPAQFMVDVEGNERDFEVIHMLEILRFHDTPVKKEVNHSVEGKTFVITGSLINYKNRDELVSVIESLGGKVAGSVSKNTDFLINNDTTSESGKNKKAKELGIPVISEEEFADLLGRRMH